MSFKFKSIETYKKEGRKESVLYFKHSGLSYESLCLHEGKIHRIKGDLRGIRTITFSETGSIILQSGEQNDIENIKRVVDIYKNSNINILSFLLFKYLQIFEINIPMLQRSLARSVYQRFRAYQFSEKQKEIIKEFNLHIPKSEKEMSIKVVETLAKLEIIIIHADKDEKIARQLITTEVVFIPPIYK